MATPSPKPTPLPELFRSFADFPSWPGPGQSRFVYTPLRGKTYLVSPGDLAVLAACPNLERLENHDRRIRESGLHEQLEGPLERRVLHLVEEGLLVPSRELLDRLITPRPDATTPKSIATVCIPTKDRPAALAGNLEAHLEARKRFKRGHEFLVLDDSSSAETRAANRAKTAELAARFSAQVRYAGPEERAAFAEALAKEAGVPVEVARAGLTAAGVPLSAAGSARNAAMLACADGLNLLCDDDVNPAVTPIPGQRPGISLQGSCNRPENWFPAPDSEPSAFAPVQEDADLLAAHETLLGRRVVDTLAALPDAAQIDIVQTPWLFFERLEHKGVRCALTVPGVAGGLGSASPLVYLLLEGPARERLLKTETQFRQALSQRALLRGQARADLRFISECPAQCLGFDARRLLPPFPALGRQSEAVFARLFHSVCEEECSGALPWAVQQGGPSASTPFIWAEQAGPQFYLGEALALFLVQQGAASKAGDPAARLRRLGEALEDAAQWSAEDQEAWLRDFFWFLFGARISSLNRALARFEGQPDYWAADVHAYLRASQVAHHGLAQTAPTDVSEAFGAPNARRQTFRLFGEYGALLKAWPALTAAARPLRAKDIRLGVGV